tara:strand:- start:17164 stop:19467 length:2304 start_codon:yes stop_codon:yes gene_type:complete
MARKKDKAAKMRELYQKLNGQNRFKWQDVNQEGHNFYLDNQLTEDETSALKDQGMPHFTINRIIPIVEMLTFYATTKDPRWQAVGTEGSDGDIAAIHADMSDYIWYINNGKAKYAQTIQDACTKSLGYLKVGIDPNSDNGMGDVSIDNIEPFDVYPDPQSRDVCFRDAAYIMIHKTITKAQAKILLPQHSSKIDKASQLEAYKYFNANKTVDARDFQSGDIHELWNTEGDEEMFVEYMELYEKSRSQWWNVFYRIEPTEEELDQIRMTMQEEMRGVKDELTVRAKEGIAQLTAQLDAGEIIQERYDIEAAKLADGVEQQMAGIRDQRYQEMVAEATREENVQLSDKEYRIAMKGSLKENITNAIKFYKQQIKLSCCVGDQFLYEKTLPSEEYPIVPFHYNYTGTPYPMSAVAPLIGKQKELNKAHQLMVHNASLGSSLRWMYTDGSIDTDHWEKFASAPGALLPVNSGYEPPKEVLPAQLSNAFAGIVAEGKVDLEYLAGIYSSMQGDTGKQHETYKGLLAQDEYGTRRVKAWMDNSILPALKQLGVVVKDYAQYLYTAQKVLRIVEPDMDHGEVREREINVPQYNEFGDVIHLWNDYSSAKFDVRVVAGNTLPVNRWAYLNEIKELFQLGVVDDEAVLAETDVRNKSKIAERKLEKIRMQNHIGELEEKQKDLEGTIETLQRQLVQAGVKDKVRQIEHDMRKKLLDSSAQLKGDLAVHKAKLDGAAKEAQVNVSGYKKDLDRDRAVKAAEDKVQKMNQSKNGVKQK